MYQCKLAATIHSNEMFVKSASDLFFVCFNNDALGNLLINKIQATGSRNRYRQVIDQVLIQMLRQKDLISVSKINYEPSQCY